MIHFSLEELAARRKAAAGELAGRGLDGLLMFRQESMYYLTGYDTFGYVFFQCLYMGVDGEDLTLLTRTPDVRQAEHTSVVEDIRVWYDAEGADPALDLREILEEHGCRGKRLGIETDAYGLTGFNLKRVEAALDGFCKLVEALDLVSRLRPSSPPLRSPTCGKPRGSRISAWTGPWRQRRLASSRGRSLRPCRGPSSRVAGTSLRTR